MTDKQFDSGNPARPVSGRHDGEVLGGEPKVGGVGNDSAKLPVIPSGDGQPQDPGAEEEIWAGRTHWKHYAGQLMLWVVANTALVVVVVWLASRVDWLGARVAFWTIAGAFVVSATVVVGRVFVKLADHRYRLTSQRLFIARGILSQTVDQTELIRVDDVRLHKSFFDRVLGLGTVTILSTDTSNREVIIEGITEADKVAEAIRSRMRAMRQKSLFIENL